LSGLTGSTNVKENGSYLKDKPNMSVLMLLSPFGLGTADSGIEYGTLLASEIQR